MRVRQASEESGSDKERERSALRADLYLCEKKAGSGYMVSFIGAGPGDPELLTIKGKKLIDSADIIIYAGSLVNPQVLSDAKEGAVIYNSAGMNLEEVLAVMKDGEEKGLKVVRVHTGDPAVYGAHREQMDALERMGIAYEVIPGVSSFLAAAAVLKKEYTLPGVSQTVILTRMERSEERRVGKECRL